MDKKPSSIEEIVEENKSIKVILSLLISKLHEVQHENEILQSKFDSLKSANFFQSSSQSSKNKRPHDDDDLNESSEGSSQANKVKRTGNGGEAANAIEHSSGSQRAYRQVTQDSDQNDTMTNGNSENVSRKENPWIPVNKNSLKKVDNSEKKITQKKRSAITGKSTESSEVQSNTRRMHFKTCNWRPGTDMQKVKEYIESKMNVVVIEINEMISSKYIDPKYEQTREFWSKSFRFIVSEKDSDSVLKPENWPERILVDRFWFPRRSIAKTGQLPSQQVKNN